MDSTFEGREFSPGKRPIVLADVGCDHGFVALSLASASMAAAANKEGQQSSSESNHFHKEIKVSTAQKLLLNPGSLDEFLSLF